MFNAIIVGEGALVIQCAEKWLALGNEIQVIATRAASVVGWAAEAGIESCDSGDALETHLSGRSTDYLFSIVNLRMLPASVLAIAERGAINFHDGPLPRYAGINVTTWALINREQRHGVSWHEMATEADTGRLLVQHTFDIASDETAFSLNAKCFEAGIESFGDLAQALTSEQISPIDQKLDERSYFAFYDRPAAACHLDFTVSSAEIGAMVSALDFGAGFPNPVGRPWIGTVEHPIWVGSVEGSTQGSTSPGRVLSLDPGVMTVSTADGAVTLTALTDAAGAARCPVEWALGCGLRVGDTIAPLSPEESSRLTAAYGRAARREPELASSLSDWSGSRVPGSRGESDALSEQAEVVREHLDSVALRSVCEGSGERALAVFALFMARLTGDDSCRLGVSTAESAVMCSGLEGLVRATVPTAIAIDDEASQEALDRAARAIGQACARGVVSADLGARYPEASSTATVGIQLVGVLADPATAELPSGSRLAFVARPDGSAAAWVYDSALIDEVTVTAFSAQLDTFAAGLAEDPTRSVLRQPVVNQRARRLILDEWNDTAQPFASEARIHDLFEARVQAAPEATAAICRGASVSYRELDSRANRMAQRLQSEGVGSDTLVGVFMERSIELLVATVGVLKAGGAYVPLDPSYPAERLRYMIEDSGLGVIIADRGLADRLDGGANVLTVDDGVAEAVTSDATSASLAYVIYTSGSTGHPKGVMVEHRNVVNFFSGMDAALDHDPEHDEPGRWLAVTSLNFDISVLELFWTLSRGYTVVIHVEPSPEGVSVEPLENADKRVDFGLFYFASDESAQGTDAKYRMLLEGARFADANGFSSVWTPERHFHAFGGLFPHPAVAAAAVATITENVHLRAGSLVSPLHHPARIAETWSMVDNLSKGRAGVSFASGWQPNDFVLKPEGFADRKARMFDDIETVRALWRGDEIEFEGPNGPVMVKTLPRPYQDELPIWVTTAGNPETFRAAGECGAHLLTHLLGQTFEQVAEKIAIYRAARREAGHDGRGIVSLMLHTYVGVDDASAREIVREPMKDYLKSAAGLVRAAAWEFPTFKKTTTMEDGSFSMDHLGPEELDALLTHAFERYYDTAGLFGSVETCTRITDRVKGLDVDEIACLFDFGVPSELALEALPRLAEVLERSRGDRSDDAAEAGVSEEDHSVAAEIHRHGVTHLQCTPSMASLLLVDEGVEAAFKGLRKLMIGGEAFPPAIAQQLSTLVEGDVINMYGPTETTIWSSTHRLSDVGEAVPIGRPIANTDIFILDRHGELLPPGAMGELCIGGAGVVRGYHDRPELTAERFIADRVRGSGGRIYRTGDLARFGPDGVLEFHGRLDHQVKLRGYRIELGEIDACLGAHPGVREAAVVVREDVPGDRRLVGYYVPEGETVPTEELRDHLKTTLPDYMVPSLFVTLGTFPLTPNRKIDRKAFPAPEAVESGSKMEYVAPSSELEETIVSVWREVLGVSRVGVDDNFFDIGGHSLLTIQVHKRLKDELARPLTLVDLFRFPTVGSLATHLSGAGRDGQASAAGEARAKARRGARSARQKMAARRRR